MAGEVVPRESQQRPRGKHPPQQIRHVTRQPGAQHAMASRRHALAIRGVMAALAIVRKSASLATGVVSGDMWMDVAHALHERKLSVPRQSVEVLHHKAKVSVWGVGIFSTGECALVLLARCSWCWRSVEGALVQRW